MPLRIPPKVRPVDLKEANTFSEDVSKALEIARTDNPVLLQEVAVELDFQAKPINICFRVATEKSR